MSCNGCRVLRRGCSEQCILRPCLEWIESPQAQGNATLFVSKFFGRSDLMSFIAAVPESKRPALFQSLLFEACGRTVNPVNGAVGLLSTGNWHICQSAVETVLAGGVLRPISVGILPPNSHEASELGFTWGSSRQGSSKHKTVVHGSIGVYIGSSGGGSRNCMENTASFGSGISEVSPENGVKGVGSKEPKLLNLFA
ncbi:LOB domain-containing protein 38 [Sesamum alatum]|uniref:LOB domain-containing protein 38 n=1 Tax=Sesamum alatum TaxID=300844 RepID=A0AAE1YRH4_9LAMI|nr:LOB domain-containing protein 38 [Sesamum alatum]